ncbi:MAG: electron transport complex subunit E [Oscillospiraceae bacterium]|jgi:electron transport complex protein RnfE|nr:electron transport complex subunit E [Oscillospiraceae bacterium]
MNYWKEFIKGIIKENPVLVSILGMCPTLAITTDAGNALGMGIATTFVLVGSNLVISLLRKIIPKAVSLPCYIVVIAAFVTFIEFMMKGYFTDLYKSLGTFLSLITVNCIILGRAEMFASKNKLLPSVLDGLGMGIGFTFALFLMGSIREIIGSGTWLASLLGDTFKFPFEPITVFIMPAGGFFVLGLIIAVLNLMLKKKPPKAVGCGGCTACGGALERGQITDCVSGG